MGTLIILNFRTGSLRGEERRMAGPDRCVLGRSPASVLRLPPSAEYSPISRRHCILDIGDGRVRVRDLGSRNGTFINGVRLPASHPDPNVDPDDWFELGEGDELQLGSLVMSVRLELLADEPIIVTAGCGT